MMEKQIEINAPEELLSFYIQYILLPCQNSVPTLPIMLHYGQQRFRYAMLTLANVAWSF